MYRWEEIWERLNYLMLYYGNLMLENEVVSIGT